MAEPDDSQFVFFHRMGLLKVRARTTIYRRSGSSEFECRTSDLITSLHHYMFTCQTCNIEMYHGCAANILPNSFFRVFKELSSSLISLLDKTEINRSKFLTCSSLCSFNKA